MVLFIKYSTENDIKYIIVQKNQSLTLINNYDQKNRSKASPLKGMKSGRGMLRKQPEVLITDN